MRSLILLLAFATPALAQTQPVQVGGYKWRPVEDGLGDVNPIGTSQLAQPVDLRVGLDFDRVYKLDGKPRLFGQTQDYYMRMNAGVMAVFPRSTYTALSPSVSRADIPPGTIYSIGGRLSDIVGQPAKEPAKKAPSNFVDRSAGKAPTATPASQPDKAQPAERAQPARALPPDSKPPDPSAAKSTVPVAEATPMRSIWVNEDYRKQRVAALLDEAAKPKK